MQPTPTSGGVANLLSSAKGLATQAPAAAPAAASGAIGKLLTSAKMPTASPAAPAAAPATPAPAATPSVTPFVAPLFGKTSNASSQPFETPASKMEGEAGVDMANQIKEAFTSSFNQGVEGATEIENGEGPLDAIASGLKVESGIAGVAFSPLAPLTNLIGQGIKMAGNALADTPLMKQYAATATPTDVKVLTALQNLGGVAMGILGAKAGDEVPPTDLEKVANDPAVVAAAKKVVEARKAAEPAAQAQALPVKETPGEVFPKSNAAGVKITKVASQMDPTLRGEIRDSVTKNGNVATHAALQDEMGMTHSQADAHIREAPVPQSAAEELEAHNTAVKQALLKGPQEHALLEEPKAATNIAGKEPIQGEGFTAADKADKGKIAQMKTINDYRAARDSFNKNPTPKTLDAVRTARAAMDDALNQKDDAPASSVEKTNTPTKVLKTAEKPKAALKPVEEAKTNTAKSDISIDRPVDETGARVTKAANDINEALVKKGVEQLPEDLQSKYQSGSYKDSVSKVTDMMGKDMEGVKMMARTGEGIPDGVHPQILFNAVEAYATKNADVGLLRDLAASPLGSRLSEAGGELGSHGFNDNPNSAVAKIREVSKARSDSFETKTKGKAADEVKTTSSELKKVRQASAPKIKDWNSFVKSLQC